MINNLKKIGLPFILISFILFLFTSYTLKNFQLFLISTLNFFILLYYFKILNENLLITIFSFLTIITLIETTLFLSNNQSLLKKKVNQSLHIKNIKTNLGYQPHSGIQKHKLYKNDKLIFDKDYTILNTNYRYTPRLNKKTKSQQINFFGGSFTFGWGLSDDETLPYFSQKFFTNSLINNYAINGFGVHQVYTQIKYSKNLIGDINILVTFNNHIPRSSCKRDFSIGSPRYILYENKIERKGWCGSTLLGNYKIIDFFIRIINKSEIKKLIDKAFFRKNLFDNKSTELYLALINEINNLLIKKNKKFYVGYISNGEKLDFRIIDFFKKNEINFFDLSLDSTDKKNSIFLDGHPTKLANIRRAKIIHKNIN